MNYRGRFAPSPTGPLHAGSLVAALASWLDARAHGGQWLVRIEDIDRERCRPEFEREILRQLRACGLEWDEPPLRQSERWPQHLAALQRLGPKAYGCACSRRDVQHHWAELGRTFAAGTEWPYPGTCRAGAGADPSPQRRAPRPARQQRLRLPDDARVPWTDRRLGPQAQDVAAAVGDFVLARCDARGAPERATYQLAVVVDDAEQGITDIVRGADLADNTPRQILLQRALGAATPRYLHTPLVCAADGQKLSKQTGALALPVDTPAQALAGLRAAADRLGLPVSDTRTVPEALQHWIGAWAGRWVTASPAAAR